MTAKDSSQPQRRQSSDDSHPRAPLTNNLADDLAAISSIFHDIHGNSMIGLGSSAASSRTVPTDMLETDSSSDEDFDDEEDDFEDTILKLREGETEVEMRRRLLADMVRLRRQVFGAFMPGGRPNDPSGPDLPISGLSLSSSPPDLVPSTTNARGNDHNAFPLYRKTSDGHCPSPPPNEELLPVSTIPPLPPRNEARFATATPDKPGSIVSASGADAVLETEASDEDAS
ncbi:hypothetical protein Sste5346_005750 [Sporothrix stenoceras]|uniref:Uncharacterized protein n=1 Tax=Sporothrix stenoceras TaxID=5173 RepID=A0ABR3Z2L9_9PEZI